MKQQSSIIHFQDEEEPSYQDLPLVQTIANLSSNSSGISSSQAFSNLSLDSTSNYALSSCISFSASESEIDETSQNTDKTVKFRRNSFGNEFAKKDLKIIFTRRRPLSFEEDLHRAKDLDQVDTPYKIKPILKKTPSLDATPFQHPYNDNFRKSKTEEGIKLKGILKNKNKLHTCNTQSSSDQVPLRSGQGSGRFKIAPKHCQSHEDVRLSFSGMTINTSDSCQTKARNLAYVNRPKSTSLDYSTINASTLKGILKKVSPSGSDLPSLLNNQKCDVIGAPRRSILKSRYSPRVAYTDRRYSNPLPKGILKKSEPGPEVAARNFYVNSVVAGSLEKALLERQPADQAASLQNCSPHSVPFKSILKHRHPKTGDHSNFG